MDDLASRETQKALAQNVLGPLAAVSAGNAVIFSLGWHTASGQASPGAFLPVVPGWLIGVVWTCLFAMMGAARWRIIDVRGRAGGSARAWLIGLMAFCCAYPVYTLGLNNEIIGFAGNIATIAVAVVVFGKLWPINGLAALAPASVIAWLCFASLYIADQQRWWW